MPTYQFEVDDDLWATWKETFSYGDTIAERLIELIEADIDGRVRPQSAPPRERSTAGSPQTRTEYERDGPSPMWRTDERAITPIVDGIPFPSHADARRKALIAAYDHLESLGTARKSDFQEVFSDHSGGYGSYDSWWKELISEHLREFPGVSAPSGRGASTWQWNPSEAPTRNGAAPSDSP